MNRLLPRSTRTDTLYSDTTHVRACSGRGGADDCSHGQADPPASAERLQGDRQPRSSGTADDATSAPRTAETAPRAACSYVLAWCHHRPLPARTALRA